MNRLLIIGANDHGKVVADIAAHCDYKYINNYYFSSRRFLREHA